MDAKEVGRVLSQFEAMGFWQMPTPDPPPVNVARCDGAEWIFEGSRDGRHHVVVRWSPEEGALRNLGLYLALTLGRPDVPRSTIY
jgi:hypothetical protein